MESCIIDSNEKLKSICSYIKNNVEILAIDTEFLRRNTYFPDLCLIQIAYYVNNELITYIIDVTVRGIELKCFIKILNSNKIKKIIHSSSQDLEAFASLEGCKKINNLEDTQLMCEFCGDEQLSYSNAVTKYMKIINFEKDKNIQISNWKKRPLTKEQIKYAKNDVFYLIDLYNVLSKKLIEGNKFDFYKNEMKYFLKKQTTNYFIENYWKKLKFDIHKINYNDLGLVKKISSWREEKAINNNISRNLIFANNLIIKLVKEKPSTKEELKNKFSLYPQIISLPREYKDELIEIIKKHIENINTDNDKKIFYMYKKGFPLKAKFEKIEKVVDTVSKNTSINSDLLLNQHDIISIITKCEPRRKVLYGWKFGLLNKYI